MGVRAALATPLTICVSPVVVDISAQSSRRYDVTSQLSTILSSLPVSIQCYEWASFPLVPMHPALPRDEERRREEILRMATELGALASTRGPERQIKVLDLPTYLIAAHQNATGTLFSMPGNLVSGAHSIE